MPANSNLAGIMWLLCECSYPRHPQVACSSSGACATARVIKTATLQVGAATVARMPGGLLVRPPRHALLCRAAAHRHPPARHTASPAAARFVRYAPPTSHAPSATLHTAHTMIWDYDDAKPWCSRAKLEENSCFHVKINEQNRKAILCGIFLAVYLHTCCVQIASWSHHCRQDTTMSSTQV